MLIMRKLFPLILIALFHWCSLTNACIGLGGCGFGGCCIGHFCAKARGTKLLKIPSGETNGNKLSPYQDAVFMIRNENDAFLECCRERGLPEACLNTCSYINYNQNILRRMFLRMDLCPLLAANDIHFCAARGRDHRRCCVMNGVTTTLARQKCLIFCDQRPQNETHLDLSYLPCFDRFESIKGCFWQWARKQNQLDRLSMMGVVETRRRSDLLQHMENEVQPPSPFNDSR